MPKARQWFRFQNATSADVVTLYIYDIIGADPWTGEGVDAQQFVRELAAIQAREIQVRIHSAGGDAFDGVAIHNALKRHPAHVVVHVDGLAASAASVIAMSGDEVLMGTGSFLMIHNAWGCRCGDAADLRAAADALEAVSNSIAEFYATKSGKPLEEVLALMAAETWFPAEDAVAAGLADEVEDGNASPAPAAMLNRFKNVPQELAGARGRPAAPASVRDVEQILRDAGCSNAQAKSIAAAGWKAAPEPRDEDGDMAELITALQARGNALALN